MSPFGFQGTDTVEDDKWGVLWNVPQFKLACYFLVITFRLCILGRKIQKSWHVPLVASARWYVISIFLITCDVNFNFFKVLSTELKYHDFFLSFFLFLIISQYFRLRHFKTASIFPMIKCLFIYLHPYKQRFLFYSTD